MTCPSPPQPLRETARNGHLPLSLGLLLTLALGACGVPVTAPIRRDEPSVPSARPASGPTQPAPPPATTPSDDDSDDSDDSPDIAVAPPDDSDDLPPDAPPPTRAQTDKVTSLVRGARALLGKSRFVVDGVGYRGDCSGFIHAVYDPASVSIGPGNSVAIYQFLQQHGSVRRSRPRPGDLIFFRNTTGKRNGITHIAMVESVLPSGTVVLIHKVGSGVMREHMNLGQPNVTVDAETGERFNDVLRRSPKRLTGQLFFAFGTPPALLPAPRIAQSK